jgi:hypothetical protein
MKQFSMAAAYKADYECTALGCICKKGNCDCRKKTISGEVHNCQGGCDNRFKTGKLEIMNISLAVTPHDPSD